MASKKLPILLISEPLRGGGITNYAFDLVEGLQSKGFDPRLAGADIRLNGNQHRIVFKESDERFGIFPTLAWGILDPFTIHKLTKWAKKEPPVLVHGLSAFAAPACRAIAKRLKIPWVLTVHHFQKRSGLQTDKNCKKLVAPSEALRTNLVNEAGIPKELISVLPIGIPIPKDNEEESTETETPEIVNKELPLVASCGALTEGKDFATLLKAARKVLDQSAGDCHFLIAGDGPKERDLRRLSVKLGVTHNVTFCIQDSFSEDLWGSIDVYIQTSRTDAYNVEAARAAAHGAPVIAASAGGLINQVKDGQTGYLVPPGDSDALAEKLLMLLEDNELRLQMSGAAKDFAAEHYSQEAMLKRTAKMYKNALQNDLN